jgi:hypothetical protein
MAHGIATACGICYALAYAIFPLGNRDLFGGGGGLG